jgi:hypothetical protein
MARIYAKIQSIAAGYLAFAVMGIFAFAIIGGPFSGDLRGKSPAQRVFFAVVDTGLDCLTGGGTEGGAFSPPRQSLLYTAMPPGLPAGLSCAALRSIVKNAPRIFKNPALPKLLI